MRPIGFSSGALAKADFRLGVAMLLGREIHALELSALRETELEPMIQGIADLNLTQFTYIAIHAPSAFAPEHEQEIAAKLTTLAHKRNWPIVVHPDVIQNSFLWRKLGSLLCIENMDRRKPVGRTADELSKIFDNFPEASFCFDIGHARQFDATMTEAYLILKRFRDKLRQVHVSEVNTGSRHDPLSRTSIVAFREVADMIPTHVPLILETPVMESQLSEEMNKVRDALPVRELVTSD